MKFFLMLSLDPEAAEDVNLTRLIASHYGSCLGSFQLMVIIDRSNLFCNCCFFFVSRYLFCVFSRSWAGESETEENLEISYFVCDWVLANWLLRYQSVWNIENLDGQLRSETNFYFTNIFFTVVRERVMHNLTLGKLRVN